jgi:hypothetical protein
MTADRASTPSGSRLAKWLVEDEQYRIVDERRRELYSLLVVCTVQLPPCPRSSRRALHTIGPGRGRARGLARPEAHGDGSLLYLARIERVGLATRRARSRRA